MNTLTCPSCGTQNLSKSASCDSCGWQFNHITVDHNTVAPQRTGSIFRTGLRRPNWVCSNVRQNVCLVRDGSGSMAGSKARDASGASLELVEELAQPVNKDGFSVAVIDFSSAATVIHPLTGAKSLHGNVKPLNTGLFGGSTNITEGLSAALDVFGRTQTPDGITLLRSVAIVFTDGCHNTGPDPYSVAEKLKSIADVVAVAFGSDADEQLLRRIASTPQHFYRCSTGRDLRSFLAKVGETMTATMAQKANATQALATMQAH
jgi:uncharacterized protein YegL